MFHDFQNLILSANIDFDVIAISISRINKKKPSVVDINLLNHSYEFC